MFYQRKEKDYCIEERCNYNLSTVYSAYNNMLVSCLLELVCVIVVVALSVEVVLLCEVLVVSAAVVEVVTPVVVSAVL